MRPSSRKWARPDRGAVAAIANGYLPNCRRLLDGGRWLRRRVGGGEEVAVLMQGVALSAERTVLRSRSVSTAAPVTEAALSSRVHANRKNLGSFLPRVRSRWLLTRMNLRNANHFVGQHCQTEQPEVGTPRSRCCGGFCKWILPKLPADVVSEGVEEGG